ncbi:MAG: methylmalonyl Co-A mutase-associated GTPase MeaB [Gemmatimonadota bacterium]
MGDQAPKSSVPPARRDLIQRFRSRELAALARAISLVENETDGFEALLEALHDGVGRARRIGITGPPGAGKSTLTASLARALRDRGDRVGVIAVDPTSPFTGGALLGDRVRMDDLATEPGIFIRSMASRGSAGGLATSSSEVADLMDAFGYGVILLETVGVGQSELEIATSADTTVLVLVPESGDAIQAMKAGLMEVADILVVNKADRPGADRLKRELEVATGLRRGAGAFGPPAHHGVDLSSLAPASGDRAGPVPGPGRAARETESGSADWSVPVLACVASRGDGVADLLSRLDAHRAWLESSGRLTDRRRDAGRERARAVLDRAVRRRAAEAWDRWRSSGERTPGADSPYEIARRLLRETLGSDRPDGSG